MCLNVKQNWNKLHFLRRRKVQICITAVYFYTNILSEGKKKKHFVHVTTFRVKRGASTWEEGEYSTFKNTFGCNWCLYWINKLTLDACTGQRKILQTWLFLISQSFFFFFAEHHNSSTATSYRAHSLGLNTNKNNTDATFGIFQSS